MEGARGGEAECEVKECLFVCLFVCLLKKTRNRLESLSKPLKNEIKWSEEE